MSICGLAYQPLQTNSSCHRKTHISLGRPNGTVHTFFSPYISCIEILHPYIRIYSVYPYILSISVCPQYISISLYTHYISKSVYQCIGISVYLDILSISSVYQYFNKSVYLVILSISFSFGGPKETVWTRSSLLTPWLHPQLRLESTFCLKMFFLLSFSSFSLFLIFYISYKPNHSWGWSQLFVLNRHVFLLLFSFVLYILYIHPPKVETDNFN